MSSVAFDLILEETRKRFSLSEQAAMEEIYRPYDHEGMMFIDLKPVQPDVFKAFLRATSQAKTEVSSGNPNAPLECWNELCSKLQHDPRANA